MNSLHSTQNPSQQASWIFIWRLFCLRLPRGFWTFSHNSACHNMWLNRRIHSGVAEPTHTLGEWLNRRIHSGADFTIMVHETVLYVGTFRSCRIIQLKICIHSSTSCLLLWLTRLCALLRSIQELYTYISWPLSWELSSSVLESGLELLDLSSSQFRRPLRLFNSMVLTLMPVERATDFIQTIDYITLYEDLVIFYI